MTSITLSPQRQEQMERYCALSGLTQDLTISKMFDLWERLVYIPEMEYLEQQRERRRAKEGFEAIRSRAMRGELPDLSMDEIDEIIAEVREAKRQKQARQ